jgi:DNA-binding NarL/FixJ family response regulator
VEDHPVVRQGLTSLIEPESDLTIVGESGSAQEARRALSETDVDLVILDLSLSDGTGLTLLEHLHATQPELPVLVVSMHDESLYARRALDAGAEGYVMKSKARSQIVEAIGHVLDGNVYLSPEMTSAILSERVGDTQPTGTSPLDSLSDRELEVFMLLGEGYERREIAEALMLSPKTIDTYKTHLKEKLSLETNAGLRRYAAVWVESSEAPAE